MTKPRMIVSIDVGDGQTRVELHTHDDAGRLVERLVCVCAVCGMRLTRPQAKAWRSKFKLRKYLLPAFTCSNRCRSKLNAAPSKADRDEDWARSNGDGRFRTGFGGKI